VAIVIPGEPPTVEIQCHGGPVAIELVVEALGEAGARLAGPEEWAESRASSSIRAEALVDLTWATTVRTAEILLEQHLGALDRELEELIKENDREPEVAPGHLDRLIARGDVGLRLISGWKVVIAGRPNVGKSRLLNALAGYQRAIVDPTPGTTRDAVSVRISLDGWPIELLDTAGLRATDDAIERSGIDRAIRRQAEADLVLKLVDRSEPLRAEDRELMASPGPSQMVASKADLPAAWDETPQNFAPGPILVVSAESGEGLDRLIAGIVGHLVPERPGPGAGVPFRDWQVERLEHARTALREGDHARAANSIGSMLRSASRLGQS
jgi:tRNA modification GTPase